MVLPILEWQRRFSVIEAIPRWTEPRQVWRAMAEELSLELVRGFSELMQVPVWLAMGWEALLAVMAPAIAWMIDCSRIEVLVAERSAI